MPVKNSFLNVASQVGFMHSAKYYKVGDKRFSLRPSASYARLVHDIMQILEKRPLLFRHNAQTGNQVGKDILEQIPPCFISYPHCKRCTCVS